MKAFSLFMLLAIAGFSFGQNLTVSGSTSVELTKTSRSGRYGGTLINGNQAQVLYVSSTKDEGAQVEEYNLTIGSETADVKDKFIGADQAEEELPWFIPQSKVEKLSTSNGKWLKAGRAFGGGMKLWRGSIKKNYVLGVYTGMEFIEEESIKPKTGDIWRITPGGFKSLSDIDALATSNGFYKDLEKYGNPLTMPANSTLLAAGVITEKVSLKSDQEYASNRVAVLAMNGMDFDDMPYDIYILPYTASTITSGLGQEDNLCSLFGPLNGPTNVASLKHLYWKDRKNHFTLMRFNDERELVDSVSFESQLMWGDYQILNGQNSTFVLAKGDAKFDGWYRGMQYKKLTGMQVTKIKDGQLQYSKLYDQDELESKMTGPAGKKVKFDLYLARNEFKEIIDLPNGDALVLGHSPLQVYALHISPDGTLRAFYLIPIMGKDSETGIYNYQYMLKGDDLILAVNQQPYEFTNDAQVSSHTSKSYGAGVVTTITTTTVTKLNEVFLQSMLLKINSTSATMSSTLEFDGKEFYPMGSFPAMFTKDAVYYTGREKGPKGKIVHVIKIDL